MKTVLDVDAGGNVTGNETFVTVQDEQATLPNSAQLASRPGLTVDTGTPGEIGFTLTPAYLGLDAAPLGTNGRQLLLSNGLSAADGGAGNTYTLKNVPLVQTETTTAGATPATIGQVTSAMLGGANGTYFVTADVLGYITGTPATNVVARISVHFTKAGATITVVSQQGLSGGALGIGGIAWADDGAGGVKLVGTGIAATNITWDVGVSAGDVRKVA